MCIRDRAKYESMAPKETVLVKLSSKLSALENIILILDQTINGKQKRTSEVNSDTSLNSLPNNEIKMLPAISLSKKNTIGIEKENIKTFLNLCLIPFISFFFLALDSSGNKISKLAASNWKIISNILLDQASTPNKDPE